MNLFVTQLKMYDVKSCGVKFRPMSLVVTYVDLSNKKLRCRHIPLRNLKQNSNANAYAEQMKKNQRHRSLLKDVPVIQIEKMLLIIQSHMKGNNLEEAVKIAEAELTVDPEKDLCKVDEDEVDKAKRIMDQSFNEKRIKPSDPTFEYDVEVDFDNPILSCGSWDSDDADEF